MIDFLEKGINKLRLEIRDTNGEIYQIEVDIEDFRIGGNTIIIGIDSHEGYILLKKLKEYYGDE